MKRFAIVVGAVLGFAGLATAQHCRVAAPVYQGSTYYGTPAYTAPVYYPPTNEVELVIAHPVFNAVKTITVTEHQVLVPHVQTGVAVTQEVQSTTKKVLVLKAR
jgi:hypothetical protein